MAYFRRLGIFVITALFLLNWMVDLSIAGPSSSSASIADVSFCIFMLMYKIVIIVVTYCNRHTNDNNKK
jgi:hypothetical protein